MSVSICTLGKCRWYTQEWRININHFKSIRHEGIRRADDLGMQCCARCTGTYRPLSSRLFSQLSAFRGIILGAGLAPCLIAYGPLSFFSRSSSSSSSSPPSPYTRADVGITSVGNKIQPCSRSFHFLNAENISPPVSFT